jgi:thermitase
MRMSRSLVALGLGLGLAACSTPDIGPPPTAAPPAEPPATAAGEYVVGYTGGASELAAASAGSVRVVTTDDDLLARIGAYVVATEDQAAVEALGAQPGVTYVQPSYIYHAFGGQETALLPTDPYIQAQWQLASIDAPGAWPSTTGIDTRIAIIDTGVDCAHPDLRANIIGGYDAIRQVTGCANDANGHGTHVAGAAAAAANGIQGVGVAHDAWILAVAVLDAGGAGSTATVARGVLWAAEQAAMPGGPIVINLSLGASADDPTLRSAVAYAQQRAVVVVAAAGNGGSTYPVYPGAYPGVISACATGRDDRRASFSQYGAWVSVCAPGVETYATTRGGGYGRYSGTSMASPVVAGVAALLRSHGVPAGAILSRLQGTGDACPGGCGIAAGAGRVNARRAVDAGAGPTATAPSPTQTATPGPSPATQTPTAGPPYPAPSTATARPPTPRATPSPTRTATLSPCPGACVGSCWRATPGRAGWGPCCVPCGR